jgi:hypothetical protein
LEQESQTIDPTELRPLMMELASMLEAGMVDSMDQITALENRLGHSKAAKPLRQLKDNVDQFDMDSALLNLKEIATMFEISLEG